MLITIKAGDGTHKIRVECHELAQRIYAEALNLDDEAEIEQLGGGWEVRFAASKRECLNAVEAAIASRHQGLGGAK